MRNENMSRNELKMAIGLFLFLRFLYSPLATMLLNIIPFFLLWCVVTFIAGFYLWIGSFLLIVSLVSYELEAKVFHKKEMLADFIVLSEVVSSLQNRLNLEEYN
jgi:hypothetical protein